MSEIGKQIKKYRTAKGLTQEQLGELVGVTTQAVSKWERGGVPDAELLPTLSNVLGVSIDALFGMEEQSDPITLVRKLGRMSRDEAFQYAFDLCWAMILGVHVLTPGASDEYLRAFFNFNGVAINPECKPRFSNIYYDQGLLNSRTNSSFKHFFLMLEPKNGLRSQLSDLEGIQRIFAALADPDTLQILLYLYTRLNTPIAASLISKNTGFSVQKVDRHMEILCQAGCAKRTTIATSEGDIYSYMFTQEAAVVALLCLADEIRLCEEANVVWDVNRQLPIMYSTDS